MPLSRIVRLTAGFSIAAASTVAGVLCLTLTSVAPAQTQKEASPIMSSAMAPLQALSSFAPVLEHVMPAVVTLLVIGERTAPAEMKQRAPDGSPAPFPAPQKSTFRAGGSGVIIDAVKGLIITNNHVVADSSAIEVSLSDGRRYRGTLIGRDPGTDVAVVQIDAKDLHEVSIGDSDQSRVGDVVLAIGNPYGLQGTATLGIISATMRGGLGHEAFEDFMQIDAAINPGNSGGALVNVRGELIGINTVGSGEAGKAFGIGFAIPINMARSIMSELVAQGTVRRGSTGVVVKELSRATIERIDMRITRGVEVAAVIPGSPGAEAGIPTGAIITMYGGKPVRSADEWSTRVATTPIGTRVSIEFESDGRSKKADMTIAAFAAPAPVSVAGDDAGGIAGLAVAEVSAGHPLYGIVRGLEVRDVPKSTPAYATGLIKGDIITAIEGIPVRSFDDLRRQASGGGMQYRLSFERDRIPAWIRIGR